MISRRASRGQATVEFGVSSIVLLLLLLGLIDLGRAFYFAVGLSGATREGARQASWYVPPDPNIPGATGVNPSLSDPAIQSAVDALLKQAGLPASTLANPTATCPTTDDGNSAYNPPYADSAYPSGIGQPLLYICYANTPGLDLPSAPTDNGYNGQDVNVIVLMRFGFASGFMQGILGPSFHLVSNTHMTIGGGY